MRRNHHQRARNASSQFPSRAGIITGFACTRVGWLVLWVFLLWLASPSGELPARIEVNESGEWHAENTTLPSHRPNGSSCNRPRTPITIIKTCAILTCKIMDYSGADSLPRALAGRKINYGCAAEWCGIGHIAKRRFRSFRSVCSVLSRKI